MSKYETYNNLVNLEIGQFEDMKGMILTKIEYEREEMRFYFTDKIYAKLYHEQECCEDVSIEDISGDLQDLVGTPLLMVEETVSYDEERSSNDHYYDDSCTWTFYRFRTIKGSVDIRWIGTSNGYYSESVDFMFVEEE